MLPCIDSKIFNHLGFVERTPQGRDYFVSDSMTGADVMISFVAEVRGSFGNLGPYQTLTAWIGRMHAPRHLGVARRRAGRISWNKGTGSVGGVQKRQARP